MKLFLNILLLAIATFFIFSCDKNRLFDSNQDIENQVWYYKDTLSFEVPIQDLSETNTYINVRHSFYFSWRNLWVKMNIFQHDSLIYQGPVNISLSQPNGHWHGKCSGDICYYSFPLKDFTNYVFPDTGRYTFQIIQDMRENPLQNISSVGLRVEFSEQK